MAGGQQDMQQMIEQAQKMQQQLMAAQQELAETEVTGRAGNGLVQATMLGNGELRGVRIDQSVVDPQDVETLQDLVVGAVADANNSVQEIAAEKMGPLAGGMGGAGGGMGLPGF